MLKKLALLAVALLIGNTAFADDTKLKVKVGDAFPDFKLPVTKPYGAEKASDPVSLSSLKGKNVFIAFYPKAKTGGCTIECTGISELIKDFPKDTVVFGASADTVAYNQEFTDEKKFGFPLLCDTELKLIKELGIQIAGKPLPQRVSFVIDKEGKIAKIYEKVTPKGHAEEVLKFVKGLK